MLSAEGSSEYLRASYESGSLRKQPPVDPPLETVSIASASYPIDLDQPRARRVQLLYSQYKGALHLNKCKTASYKWIRAGRPRSYSVHLYRSAELESNSVGLAIWSFSTESVESGPQPLALNVLYFP